MRRSQYCLKNPLNTNVNSPTTELLIQSPILDEGPIDISLIVANESPGSFTNAMHSNSTKFPLSPAGKLIQLKKINSNKRIYNKVKDNNLNKQIATMVK